MSACTTKIPWYITVLAMERLNVGKCVVLAVAVIFILTGDYPSFFRHIKTII